jgi:uncharacterized protein (DUF1697 family)
MTRCFAFLRGVNLGMRTVKMDELRAAFEKIGFAGAQTLIASGNVVFDGAPDAATKQKLEQGLEAHFGFPVGVVLRSFDDLKAMIADGPFGETRSDNDTKRYVYLFADPVAGELKMPFAIEGDCKVLKAEGREIYAVGHRQPDGRFGPGLDDLGKLLPRGALVTNRNWNTILRLIEKEAK